MTLTASRPSELGPLDRAQPQAIVAAPPPPGRQSDPLTSRTIGPAVALVMALTALLFFGFLAFLLAFSGLSEARAQHSLREQMFHQLSQAVAPTGAVANGRPVAVLDVPALDIHNMVIVQGTSSRTLMNGPGHVPASVLPGQAGVSVVYGKRTTYGAPFASLLSLNVGDTITTTTGQGVSHYRVTSFGDSLQPAPANSANELVLVTGAKSWWPDRYVMIAADLTSSPYPTGAVGPSSTSAQQPLGRDVGASLIPLTGWCQVLLLVAVGGTVAWYRLPRWPVLLCLGSILVTAVWCVYENAAGMLPNLL